MFDRICSENGITHRLTKPRSPTTTGKVKRFHQTLQRELLDDVEVWATPQEAQAAIDVFRHGYNTGRRHQSLGMAFRADRFSAPPAEEQLPVRLPPTLVNTIPAPRRPLPALPPSAEQPTTSAVPVPMGDEVGLAVEVTRLVPASGNLTVCGQQFWLSPTRAGLPVTLWADTTVVHLLVDGVRLKTVPFRLTRAHLRQLLADSGRPGPPPVTAGPVKPGAPVEVDRLVNATGLISLAGRQHPVGYHFAGRRVTVRLDRGVLHLLDTDRTLLRSLPNPSAPPRKPASAMPGPPDHHHSPHLSRCPSNAASAARGSLVIAGQRIHVGIGHAGQTLTVEAADTTFRVHDGDQLLTRSPAPRPSKSLDSRSANPNPHASA
ncbi:integrase core domain-containing protein [Micromonospora sp. GCM10011542]|uniref:integrase core domain-containing protein n=1 Tax=Micromonospora sp. GCM10011542 TaxID=3317337 RepID=UPI003618B715